MQREKASEEAIQAVLEATDIVETISSHLELRRVGASWRGLCPFHAEKSPSFYVSPQKRIFKCFGCGAGGNVISFLMRLQSRAFPEVLRDLGDRAGIQVYDDSRPGELTRLLKMHDLAQKYFRQSLKTAPDVLEYIASRGLSEASKDEFGLGFAPVSWDGLLRFLQSSMGALPAEALEQSGLFSPKRRGDGFVDRFRGRLMFPIRDARSRVIAFGGRALEFLSERAEAKYMNSPQTPLFDKSRQLYGLERLKREEKRFARVILVEGYLDAIALHQAGLQPVAAPLGTGFTAEQVRLLEDRFEEVILLFDGDDAGHTAMLRAVERMVNAAMKARAVRLPDGQDPLELLQRDGQESLVQSVESASDAMRFYCEQVLTEHDLTERQGKERAWRRLKSFFEGVNPMLLSEVRSGGSSELIEFLSRVFNVDEGILRTQFFGLSRSLSGAGGETMISTRKKEEQSDERGLKLLLWSLADPALKERVAESCDMEDFAGDVLSELWQRIFKDENAPLSLDALMAEGSEKLKGALSTMAWREEGRDAPEEREFGQVLKDFCVERIENRLAPTTAALEDPELAEEKRDAIFRERRHLMTRRRHWMLTGLNSG